MATPRRIFRIYAQVGQDAETIRDFAQALGEKVSGTVNQLIARDADKLLRKWGEEMHELCGVIDGSHDDPYLMEATQTYYWACLFSVVRGATWDDIRFDEMRRQAVTCGIGTIPELRTAVDRVVATADVKPEKLFLLWNVADLAWRAKTPVADQWTIEQLMEADLHEMKGKGYLAPVLKMIQD